MRTMRTAGAITYAEHTSDRDRLKAATVLRQTARTPA
jgi:hypothetical protein